MPARLDSQLTKTHLNDRAERHSREGVNPAEINARNAESRPLRGRQNLFQRAVKRWGGILALIALGMSSLLAFPSVIPWMLMCWLLLHTLFVLAGQASWMPLAALVTISLIKNVNRPTSLIALLVVCALVIFWNLWRHRLGKGDFRQTKHNVSLPIRSNMGVSAVTLPLLWATWDWVAVDWHCGATKSQPVPLMPDRPIVCVGDSLTATRYPKVLAQRITVPVIDEGHDGITSDDAVRIIENHDFWLSRPQAVVLEIGGHDYNQGLPWAREKLVANLEKIIVRCRRHGAEVILVEIPRGFCRDSFCGIERQLSRRFDLQLVPDSPIRQFVFFSPIVPPGSWLSEAHHLSEDGLHPNERGNEVFVRYIAAALKKVFGPGILR